ncbi:MAG: hypothetical protein HOP28_08810 [Gemmatimonadales bacterium]|nr:hypothetical protein [Gemmatimonadales bacterium]
MRGTVGFGGGVSLPMGDFGEGFKTGFVGQVTAGFAKEGSKFGARVNGTFQKFSVDLEGSDGSAQIMGAMADLVVSPGTSNTKPYLLGGVGFQNFKDGGTHFAWNAGGGVSLPLGARHAFFIEARYLSISGDGGSSTMVPITAGIRLGGR